MAGPGGILRAFSGLQTIKKVPKERGTRSNAGLGASGHIVFFTRLSIWFRLSCGYAMLRLVMILFIPTISRPLDGLMSLSFLMDLRAALVMMGRDFEGIYRAGICLRIFSRARLRVDDGTMDFSKNYRRYITTSLRDIGVIVSRLARSFGTYFFHYIRRIKPSTSR
jgi:hypothetical protein